MNFSGWDQQALLRHVIVFLAVAALTLILQMCQRREGVDFHGARLLRASLVYRCIGPIALFAGVFIGVAMTNAHIHNRVPGMIVAFAFAAGGAYLYYALSIRRIAWRPFAIAIWTPLKKWRTIEFADIIMLGYSGLKQELLIIGPDLTIGAGDSFHGFEQLIGDLRRARPDLFGDDDGEPEAKSAAEAGADLVATPIATS